jgi:D-serine ammonia-lyase
MQSIAVEGGDVPGASCLPNCIDDLPVPSALLDLDIVKQNCDEMLAMVQKLGLGFRAHIKTHKVRDWSHHASMSMTDKKGYQTIELSRLQVGDDDSVPANFVVSTLLELEKLVPLFEEYRARGRKVNVGLSGSYREPFRERRPH